MITSTLSPVRPRVAYMEINSSVINAPTMWDGESYKSAVQSPKGTSPTQTQTDMFKSVTLSPIHKNSSESLKHLLELKQKRKLIEANAKLLAGRVMNLSRDGEMSRSHTQEMKAKSQELIAHRLEREAKKKAQEAAKAWYVIGQKSLEDLRATINDSRLQHLKEIDKVREIIHREKREGAKIIKGQKVQNLETVYSFKLGVVSEKEKQYEKVKEDEEKVPSKVKEALKKRLEPVRDKKQGQIRDEKNKTKTRFFEIAAFSKKEDVMLDKLKQAELFNSMAQSQYTEIAEMPIDELMSKHGYFLKRRVLNKSIGSQDKLTFKSF